MQPDAETIFSTTDFVQFSESEKIFVIHLLFQNKRDTIRLQQTL